MELDTLFVNLMIFTNNYRTMLGKRLKIAVEFFNNTFVF